MTFGDETKCVKDLRHHIGKLKYQRSKSGLLCTPSGHQNGPKAPKEYKTPTFDFGDHSDDLTGYIPVHFYFFDILIYQYDVSGP